MNFKIYKKYILLLIINYSLFSIHCFSQDTILKLNGKRINTKILKENENEIVCTLPDNTFNCLQKINNSINTWSIGLGIGSMLPYGEIRQYNFYPFINDMSERRVGFNLDINKKMSSYFTLQAQFAPGQLYGSTNDGGINNGGRYFEADLNEFTLNVIINLNKLFCPSSNDETARFGFYAKAGIGLLQYRSILRDLKTDKYLGNYGYNFNPADSITTYGNMLSAYVIPVGAGIKYRISNSFDLKLEALLKYTGSKNIDVINGSNKNDVYGMTALELNYKLGKAALKNEKTVDKSDIYYYSRSDGKRIMTFKGDSTATVEDMGKYIEGEEYAIKTYNPVISTIGSVAAGLVGGYLPFYGVLVPVVYVIGASSVSPLVRNGKGLPVIPESKLNDKYFMQGYKDKARRIELKRSVIGSLAGLTAMIIIKTINFKINYK